MFQNVTKNNAATFSRLIQVETKPGLMVPLEKPTRRLWENVVDYVHQPVRGKRFMGERTYLVDFRHVFEQVGPAEDLFYFYPHELEGFVESCVMATQREEDITVRDVQIFRDLNNAMSEWTKKEEEASFYSNFTFNRNYSVEEYEVREATKVGAIIDEMVHATMSVIRDVHGDYAIDERSLEWTSLHALKMRLRF